MKKIQGFKVFVKKSLQKFLMSLLFILPLTFATYNGFAYVSNNNSIGTKVQNSDIIIQTKILTAYTLNSQLNPFEINVAVENQKVTLTGNVQDENEKFLAEEIAKNVEGVNSVNNQITIEKSTKRSTKPSFTQSVEDATTTAAVKTKLLMNSSTSGLEIHVKTVNGIVTLTGAVNSKTEKNLAGKLASYTSGVTKVKNNLVIK
ncbi:MAG: Osmotically-inducible protein Y [Legionellaceae bacterium]